MWLHMKKIRGFKMKFNKLALFSTLAVASGSVLAAPVDLTSLTASVDFSTATAAILATAAIMVGVYVAWKAAKMVIGAVKGL